MLVLVLGLEQEPAPGVEHPLEQPPPQAVLIDPVQLVQLVLGREHSPALKV